MPKCASFSPSVLILQTYSQPRAVPSPAFNQEPKRNEVHPLQNVRQSEMDDSMVGFSGGEIFHEMMLRQGVKHIFGYPGGAILPESFETYSHRTNLITWTLLGV